MRITFLGTSHGYPEPNRKCSSALVEVEKNKYLIDIGCDVVSELTSRRIPLETINAIFVTHMHGDHTNGLVSFLDVCSWKFTKVNPEIYLPHNPVKVHEAINTWTSVNGTKLRELNMNEVHEGLIFDDGTLKVTAFRTKHIAVSYAYLLEAEGKRVLFSGDLCHKGPEHDFPISVLNKPLDLAVCESAHFNATAYLPLFEGKDNLKKLCINHFSHRRTKSVYELDEKLDIPTVIAFDGTQIEV
jgi:ribonuclease BN (tRNA processing enzyme)